MKIVFICFLLLIVAGLGWTYNKHPEAIDDFRADVTNDPDGIHADLQKATDSLTALKKKYLELTETNSTLTAKTAELEDKVKSLSDKLAAATQPAPPPVSLSAPVVAPPSEPPAQPNWTWTTTDGKTYNNVVITKVDGGFVTILHADGGARIPISTLPPDIQARLKSP